MNDCHRLSVYLNCSNVMDWNMICFQNHLSVKNEKELNMIYFLMND